MTVATRTPARPAEVRTKLVGVASRQPAWTGPSNHALWLARRLADGWPPRQGSHAVRIVRRYGTPLHLWAGTRIKLEGAAAELGDVLGCRVVVAWGEHEAELYLEDVTVDVGQARL